MNVMFIASHRRRMYEIQFSAVIARFSIIRYYINNYTNWGRISIRCWIHKRHPIPHPNGRVMGCLLGTFARKFYGTALYIYLGIMKKLGLHMDADMLLHGYCIPKKLFGLLSNFWATESLGQKTVSTVCPWCIFYLFPHQCDCDKNI